MDYWNNISRMQAKQTAKGLETYGQPLEQNTALNTVERIEMLEEELIDALMYLEHLKYNINTIKAQAYDKGYEDGSLTVTEELLREKLKKIFKE